MFGHVADMWQRLTDVFLAAARSAKATAADLAAVQAVLEQARLSLKLLRLFVAHGSPDYHKLPAVVQFFPILVARHRAMLEVRYAVPEEHKLSEEVDKYITWCNKIYVDAQSKEPLSFVHVYACVHIPVPACARVCVICVNMRKSPVGRIRIHISSSS